MSRKIADGQFVVAAFTVYTVAAGLSVGAGRIFPQSLRSFLFWWPIVASLPFFGLVLGRTDWLEQSAAGRVLLLSGGTITLAVFAVVIAYLILTPGVFELVAKIV